MTTPTAAIIEGSVRLEAVPADIAALLDAADDLVGIAPDEMTAGDGESPEAIEGNGDFLAWIDDFGHGTLELKARRRRTRAAAAE